MSESSTFASLMQNLDREIKWVPKQESTIKRAVKGREILRILRRDIWLPRRRRIKTRLSLFPKLEE